MRVGELFSGIGGFGLAAQRAGCDIAWASEIDDFATSVYGARFPNIPQLGDVTKIEPELVDLITAGFPCQDLSVAGKRKGLVGERSGLFWEIIRVAQRLRPRWLLLENVPGLLSSHRGRDFETVLAALDDIGYGVAWRVLDAQFFGVPQRRRRVFIVGHLGGPCPAEVLFEPEDVSGDSEAGSEARPQLATDIAAGIRSGGKGRRGVNIDAEAGLVTQALTRSHGAGGADDNDAQGGLIVIEDAGRKMSGDTRVGLGISEGGPCYTHQAGRRHAIARPITATSYKGHDEDTDTIVTAATLVNPGRQYNSPQNLPNLILETRPRRLTPRECERLQGFPDDWTLIDGASDSARYRALGNAVAVPCVEWIIRRLVACGASVPAPRRDP